MKDARRTALQQLVRWEEDDRYLGLSLSRLPDEERGFVTALVYGVAEHKLTLDYQISSLAGRSDIDPVTRQILRLGLYQLQYMKTVPAHAAVDLTVSLARNRGEAGFVNALLRTALRTPEKTALPPREKNELRYLSLRYSLPLPTLRLLCDALGRAEAEAYLAACEETVPLSVTVNTCRTDRAALLAAWQKAGIAARPSALTEDGILIDGAVSPAALPGFAEGLFFVQDEAARLAVGLLAPKSGETVADACAAPGGKSFAAAVRMKGQGKVFAYELHESKLPLIESGAARLGLDCIRAAAHDSRTPDPALTGRADAVICDVPCSGMGVLRKKPDIRYKDTAAWSALPSLQYEILCASAAYVRPGGRLLYATCTVFDRENGEVVDRFLSGHPDFAPLAFTAAGERHDDGRLLLLPEKHGTDGFFIALMQKKEALS